MLAWIDSGLPSWKILYTYFRVSSTNTVEWHGTVWTRSGSKAVGNLSAAVFQDRFYLGYKSPTATNTVADPGNKVIYMSHPDTQYTNWSSSVEVGSGNIIDPPTWIYDNTSEKESAIIWTEVD